MGKNNINNSESGRTKKGFIKKFSDRINSRPMSESLLMAFFLTISGGFQDSYSYFLRGKVFANAQTGNIVLMSSCFFNGEFGDGLRYLLPLMSFSGGILLAEAFRRKFGDHVLLFHWKQFVLLFEIILLFITGFIPERYNIIANAIVSFSCAMQVQSFRRLEDNVYASTMCIGNIRSCMDNLCSFLFTKNKKYLHSAIEYFFVLVSFFFGARLGFFLKDFLGLKAIWVSSGLLLICFTIMLIRYQIFKRLRKKITEEEREG